MSVFYKILFCSFFGFIWAQTLVVVTTTSDLAAIAQEVGGSKAFVSSIHNGKQDPHYLTAKPSYMVQVGRADLFIRIGMELEIGWEPLLIKGARNPSVNQGSLGFLDASTVIVPLDVPSGQIDRSMGDVHAYGNPHYWLDPYNARKIAQLMANRMGELAPANQSEYQSNATQFIRKIDVAMFGEALVNLVEPEKLWTLQEKGQLNTILQEKKMSLGGWAGKMAPHKNAKVITYHRSWTYLLNRFHLEAIIELEPKPGISPSTAHLMNVIKLGMAQKPSVILMEPYYNTKPADLVGAKIGAKVVVAPNSVGGREELRTYFDLIDFLVNQLSSSL